MEPNYYLNAKERSEHVIMLAMQQILKDLSESKNLPDSEKKLLKESYQRIFKFNESIFARLGDAYRRRLMKTAECNKVRLVGNYEPCNQAISHSAVEDLMPMLDKLTEYFCVDCDKEKFNDCPVYSICVACGADGKCDKGCPFRW